MISLPLLAVANICELDSCPFWNVNCANAPSLWQSLLGLCSQFAETGTWRSLPRALPRLEKEAFRGLEIPASSFSPAREGGIHGLSFFLCFLVLCVSFPALTNICEQHLCPLSNANFVAARFLC